MCPVFTGVELLPRCCGRFPKEGAIELTGPWPVRRRRRYGAYARDLFRRACGGRDAAGCCCEWHWVVKRPAAEPAGACAGHLFPWGVVRGWRGEAGLPVGRDRSGG